MLERRKYFLVAYQLSGIQAGIQAGHSSDEYNLKYPHTSDAENLDFLTNHKTWIVLNGGTTNDSLEYPGTINKDVALLKENNIKHTIFREPDLGNVITAVCLIADERVFKKDIYPDFNFPSYSNWLSRDCREVEIPNGTYSHDRGAEATDFNKDVHKYLENEAYEKFVNKVGVEVAVLKKILNNKPKF